MLHWFKISILFFCFFFQFNANAVEVFRQDKQYIYRDVPHTIALDDGAFMSDLLNGASQAALDFSRNVLDQLDMDTSEMTKGLEQAEAEISAHFDIQYTLDGLNDRLAVFRNENSLKSWKAQDFFPKSISVMLGFGVSRGFGFAIAGSITVGITLMVDRVSRIKKSDIQDALKDREDLTMDEIKVLFAKAKIQTQSEKVLKMDSYYRADSTPVFIFAPAVGTGAGGGKTTRFVVSDSWWKGNRILEPEDLYGWGMAYSQDTGLFGAGHNLKIGPMNSDNITGLMDYLFASFSIKLGPQLEFSPAKLNAILRKHPLWALEKLCLDEKVDQLFKTHVVDSLNKEWADVTGQTSDVPQQVVQPGS